MSSWPAERKLAATLFALLGFAALACAALYLSAVIFLLLNKANPSQARLLSITHYWALYADEELLRKKLIASIVVSGVGVLLVLPAALLSATRPQRRLHGDARFANPGEVARAGLLNRQATPSPSILIGRYRGSFLTLPGQLSVMLSAPTRSGKGVGVVIPNLLHWPDSAVVLDIKGENYDITAGFRAAHGQDVYAFSPFDDAARSHRWNPLSAVRSSPLHRVGDLLTIGQVFFPNDGSGTSSEAFFNDQARNLFLGLGLFLLESPTLPRTIGELLRQSSGKGQSLKGHLTALIEQRRSDAAPYSDECVDALQRLLANSENTLTSIVATFNAPLTIFADAVVDAATSADDFRLDELRRRRMSIYVRIPPNRLQNARPLLNLFFSQLVSLNTQHLPEQDPTLTVQCLLVNDEFTAMGRVGIISSAAAFLAGYNLRLLTVVQAMSQLDAVYGEKEARTFATNHGLQILYAPREQRDADEYSAMLGHFTERATSRGRSRSFSEHGHSSVSQNESDQRRALLLPQEFKELGSERLVVIFENCKPILAEKIRYHRDELFKTRLLPPPKVPQIDMDLHFARVQQRWSYAEDEVPADKGFDINRLAQDFSDLMLPGESASAADITACVDDFFARTVVSMPEQAMGGVIEEVAESAQAELANQS
ncbi:type IV secretory system conjugative DNA transfer family protein [Roseateles oligotrophus]|uniref:Type IV secretory system conjugative DNA transfer family protein n=1 Tax=Roseateles oligotrophus TaxID=1769250 RepID=A0ABT2YAB5_9BURK|nr:type IV secretory system conjugative DNA transfer family protein [Roseateles oligotrophus]MCV2366979.1 type IV secretory system conjugative DNA transfer family protein [Roseateles oligotrophus]